MEPKFERGGFARFERFTKPGGSVARGGDDEARGWYGGVGITEGDDTAIGGDGGFRSTGAGERGGAEQAAIDHDLIRAPFPVEPLHGAALHGAPEVDDVDGELLDAILFPAEEQRGAAGAAGHRDAVPLIHTGGGALIGAEDGEVTGVDGGGGVIAGGHGGDGLLAGSAVERVDRKEVDAGGLGVDGEDLDGERALIAAEEALFAVFDAGCDGLATVEGFGLSEDL